MMNNISFHKNVTFFPSADGYKKLFQFLGFMTREAMNMDEQAFLEHNIEFFGYILWSDTFESFGRSILTFLRDLHNDFLKFSVLLIDIHEGFFQVVDLFSFYR